MASKFTITAELNLQTKNLSQVVNNLRQQFQGTNLNIKIKDLAKTESQLRGIASSASEASKESKLLGNSLNQAFKRFTVITAVTGTLVGFTRSLKKGVSQAIEFEREIVKIAQATGKTVSQLRGLVSEINKVSTAFGVSSQELTLASRTLTQAGFAADKVAGALKVLAQTELAATFESIQDTTEGAIALLNQFGREAQRTGSEVKFLEQSFSAINQVSKEFAVESSDIVTAIRTTGSAFESAGGSLNELIALFTSVRSTTRESAESIATGFRTIFTRVQRVDTINALRDLGIELQDAEGKFVGPIEAAKRLSVALQTIDPKDFRFNLVVEELGGFRQVSKVIPLIQQFAVTQKALNVAQGASGSLAKDAETAQQSLAVQIAKTREEFSRLIRDIVDTSTFQSTIKAILGLANAFIQVADTVKPLIPLIAGFAAIKIGNALGVGLRSFASKGAMGRDVPIGFATGGLVPGSGNGDTVPAMLTPGEFVIRKSSVNKLGADNLARVNKYADGGAVQYYKRGTGLSGVKKIKPSGETEEAQTVKWYLPTVKKALEEQDPDKRKKAITTALNATEFTHLDKLGVPSNLNYKKKIKGKRQDITAIYSNLGIDLPKGWNRDWDKKKNNIGVFGNNLKEYIHDHDIFKTLLSSGKHGLPTAYKGILQEAQGQIKTFFTSSIPDNAFYDTDYDVDQKGLGKKLITAIQSATNDDLVTAIVKPGSFRAYQSGTRYGIAQTKTPTIIRSLAKSLGIKVSKNKDLTNEQYLKMYNLLSSQGITKLMERAGISSSSAPWEEMYFGGLIQKFEKGGRAEAFRGARAITIPEPQTYTYNKPAGIDLDGLTSDSKNYKVNAGDRLEYNRINHNIDLDKENVSSGLYEEYKAETDPAKRGKIFERILLSLGKVQSLSKMQNARLDAISASGNPSEIKSRQEAMNIKELEEKLWGAIVSNASGSLAEMMTRERMNSNRWTEGEDLFNIGTIDVFEDITGGLGKEVNAKEVRTRQEVQAAKTAKEVSKNAIAEARAKLQAAVVAVVGDNNNLYNLKGKVLSPLSGKGEIYSDTVTAVREALNIDKVADLWPAIAQMQPSEIQKAVRNSIQRKALGGFIEKFANGGFSSGTDTVPAMLTPGEFVVNKKSAQKIGYASLNRMNKVGKYASGGPVQYFASGTSGTGVTGGAQVLGVSRADINSLVDHFGTTITEVEMRLNHLAKALINLGVTSQSQQVVGQKVVQQTLANAKNLKDFDAVMKTNIKNVKNQQLNQKIEASSGSAQAVLDDVKLLKLVGKVDKGFVTTIEKMISSIVKLSKDGATADKALKQLGQQLTILGPAAANSLKVLTEAAFTAARGGQAGPSQPKKQSTPQTPEQKARTQAVLEAARQGRMPEKKGADLSARLEKLSSGTSQGTTNLLLMASAAESVIAQFSGLDEASKSAASAFGATIATYLAVGGQLKNLGVSLAQGLLKRSQEKAALDKSSRAFNSNSNAVNKNTMKQMGGNVKGEKGESKTLSQLTKGLEVFDAALVGFSVAMGLASAAAAYYNEIARKSADEMADTIKKFKEEPGTVSKDTLVSKSSQAFTDAGAASSAAGLLNWKSIAAMGVGAVGGAAAGVAMGGAEGSILGPYGSAIGGVIGGLVGGLTGLGTAAIALKIEYENQKKSMENAGKAYGQSVYALGKATNDAQNFLKDIDKKSDKQIGTQIDKTASNYQSSLALLATSQMEAVNAFGSIEQVPDALKQAFEDAKNSAKALRAEFDKMVAAQTSRKLQDISRNIGTRGFSATGAINKFAEGTRSDTRANISQELLSNYSPKIAQLEKGGFEAEAQNLKNSLQSLSKIKAEESVLTLKKNMQEASIQIVNQKIAMEKELRAREAVVGSLNRELALKDAFANFKFSLEQGANSLTAMDAVFSGAVSGLKSNVADMSTLDLSTPLGANKGAFEKALSDISAIGPAGQQLSQNFAELQAVLPNLETQLNSIDLSSFADPTKSGKAIDDLIGGLGIDKGGAVASALKDSFSAAFSSKEMTTREGVGDPKKQIETVLSTFRDFAKNLGDRGKEVLDVLKSYETRSREIQDRILQSQQKELELRLQGLDSQKTLAQNIASARGKKLTLGESDQFRNQRQSMLAGNLGGNAEGIGRELNRVRETLKKGGIPDDVARGLQGKAKNLEMALGELADQSNRTSDIMSKIDEARAKRETITGAATKYAFGTQEEKAKTDEAFQALGSAFATGDINSIPDEMKGAVSGLLQEFKDIPLLGGMTGKQIEKELTARQFEQMGQTDIAQMVRSETSTPEEKLIQELKNTADSEAAARQVYLEKEAQIQAENNNALKENTNALRSYVANIAGREGQLNQVQQRGMQTFGQRADVGQLEAEKKALEADKLKTEEKLKIVTDLSTKLAESIDKAATTYITALNKGYSTIGGKAGGAARGGLIPNDLVYRAGGGSIFQPRGTDTVPAMLTPGEFVMSKGAVSKHGVGFMQSLNSGGSVGYYANGGLVGEQFTQFMNQFQEMAQVMSGMTMTHKITVDGQLNIGGINGEQIATQIRDAIGNYVGEIVSKKINDFKGRAG